jgi:hypothetical protein
MVLVNDDVNILHAERRLSNPVWESSLPSAPLAESELELRSQYFFFSMQAKKDSHFYLEMSKIVPPYFDPILVQLQLLWVQTPESLSLLEPMLPRSCR